MANTVPYPFQMMYNTLSEDNQKVVFNFVKQLRSSLLPVNTQYDSLVGLIKQLKKDENHSYN
jgi:hypothetical protein